MAERVCQFLTSKNVTVYRPTHGACGCLSIFVLLTKHTRFACKLPCLAASSNAREAAGKVSTGKLNSRQWVCSTDIDSGKSFGDSLHHSTVDTVNSTADTVTYILAYRHLVSTPGACVLCIRLHALNHGKSMKR